jgi:hypothetical protein
MKIIFLDIDGVLNVHSVGSKYERDRFGHLFVQDFVDNLRSIVEATDAKIVISSTWRMAGLQIMKELWEERGLPGEVIDITTNAYEIVQEGREEFYDRVERGHEIQEWIDSHSGIDEYVILDDDNDFLDGQRGRLVRTANNINHPDSIDIGYGLTKECAKKAIRILGHK